jgi:hypothetical protein
MRVLSALGPIATIHTLARSMATRVMLGPGDLGGQRVPVIRVVRQGAHRDHELTANRCGVGGSCNGDLHAGLETGACPGAPDALHLSGVQRVELAAPTILALPQQQSTDQVAWACKGDLHIGVSGDLACTRPAKVRSGRTTLADRPGGTLSPQNNCTYWLSR